MTEKATGVTLNATERETQVVRETTKVEFLSTTPTSFKPGMAFTGQVKNVHFLWIIWKRAARPLHYNASFLKQGSHSLEKSLNFRGSPWKSPWFPFFPWKVLKFLCKSLKSPWLSFNFECIGLESVFFMLWVVQDRVWIIAQRI